MPESYNFPSEKLKEIIFEILDEWVKRNELIKQPEPPEEEFLCIADVSRILKRDRSRVYAYVKAGILKAYRINGIRSIRFKRSELEKAIKCIDIQQNIRVLPK